ncbi:MAG TPA: glycosyltransferase [Steroidobacteraceae bacterium]|nr:glycosyltransferase [Steroidobacteraceae bacterium]
MSPRPTLLIVSYHCAPSPAVGAKRMSFLAREFTAQGYDVHIIANELEPSKLGAADASLPLAGTVHRVRSVPKLPLAGTHWFARKFNSLLRRLLAPVGIDYFWAGAAAHRGVQIAKKLPRGIVIATTPPHAAAIAGARIARRLGWPLVLDYRDPWSAYDWPAWRRGKLELAVARPIEAALVKRSAARVLNTPAMREFFEKGFPEAPPARNFVIPNGFDPVETRASPPASGPIEIVHAGEIYTGRSLVPVLRAARELSTRHPDRPVHVTTYGDLPPPEVERIRDANLGAFLTVLPRIPFAELFARLQRAHVLLAVVGDHMLYSTPYKVYDYMAAGRPILGLAPRGAALFGMLAESGAGICEQPGDDAGIERALEKLLFAPGADTAPRTERYRWSNLAVHYRAVIETVWAGDGRPRTAAVARDAADAPR